MSPSDDLIDWTALARSLGTLTETGEHGGTNEAQAALIALLGPRQLEHAVDHYVDFRRGCELARSVLWLLRPPAAMEHCMRIYREDPDLERRRAAVELLRVVADARALRWIDDFLSDPDGGIQNWGIGVLDQLVYSDLVAHEGPAVEALLVRAEAHESAYVREQARFIREMIASRGGRTE